jgi:hypothetical protein
VEFAIEEGALAVPKSHRSRSRSIIISSDSHTRSYVYAHMLLGQIRGRAIVRDGARFEFALRFRSLIFESHSYCTSMNESWTTMARWSTMARKLLLYAQPAFVDARLADAEGVRASATSLGESEEEKYVGARSNECFEPA